MTPLASSPAGISRIQPLGKRKFTRSAYTASPATCSWQAASIAAIASAIASDSLTSASFRTRGAALILLQRIASDEELLVVAGRRRDAAPHQPLPQRPHLVVVDARRRLADRAAVEAVQPVLILPDHAVDEPGAADVPGGHLGICLAGGVESPVALHGVVEASLLEQ